MLLQNRWFRRVVVVVALILASPALLFEAVYRWGLYELGAVPVLPEPTAPSFAADVLWLATGESLEEAPWLWVGNYFRPFGHQVLLFVGRQWAMEREGEHRSMGRWHLTCFAATVWYSRHASTAQLKQILVETSYFGRGAYGLKAAAAKFFSKSVEELTLDEAAQLAGLPLSPDRFDPKSHPEAAERRRLYVLGRVREAGLSRDSFR